VLWKFSEVETSFGMNVTVPDDFSRRHV